MNNRAATLIAASLLAIFHIVVVVAPVISSGATGEEQGWLVVIFDMPLVLILQAVPFGGWILFDNTVAYTVFFCVVGTLMYAAVGALIGSIIDRSRAKRKKP